GRFAEREPGFAVSGAVPAGCARVGDIGVARDGEQPEGEVLHAYACRPEAAGERACAVGEAVAGRGSDPERSAGMSIRAWWSRVLGSLRRGDVLDREMDAEMQFHVEMATKRNVERGMSAEEAERAAKLAFGSADAFREEGREAQRARV